jgi:hypothetical protein
VLEEGPKSILRHWHFATRFATSFKEDAYATLPAPHCSIGFQPVFTAPHATLFRALLPARRPTPLPLVLVLALTLIPPSLAATFLVFLSASAGAGVVPTDFRPFRGSRDGRRC